MTWHGTRVLRHILQFAAALLSWYIGLSRISDNKHHWSDVLAGYVLGVTVGVLMVSYTFPFLSTFSNQIKVEDCVA